MSIPAPAHDGFAEVNSTRLYYEVHGAGPAVLLLHGFTLDRRMWRRQVEALAARHQVVVYDGRGFGRSALPDRTPYRHCDDAAALCDHLGLDRIVAVGHSLGGHHLLELALIRPALVAGLVTVCMSGLAGIPFPADLQASFAAINELAPRDLPAARRIWAACGWFASARRSPAVAAELDAMLADYSGWHWTWTGGNPAHKLEPAAADQLAALRARLVVVTGDLDLPYNDTVGDALIAGVPGATRVRLADAGHMAPMEQPDAVSRAIADLAAAII